MPTTNATQSAAIQRNVRDFSLSFEEESRRDGILRTAYVRIGDAFQGSRPEPRRPWDRAADGTETRWKKLLVPIRMAVASAVVNCDQQQLDKVLEAADAFFDECKADYRSIVPSREEESITQVALDETHYEGEANKVEALLLTSPTPTNADRAVIPLTRQYERLGKLIRGCRRAARSATAKVV